MSDERKPQADNMSAGELGDQSSYEDTTDMQRQMSRGDETKGDANKRDAAGAPAVKNTEEARQDRDTSPVKRD